METLSESMRRIIGLMENAPDDDEPDDLDDLRQAKERADLIRNFPRFSGPNAGTAVVRHLAKIKGGGQIFNDRTKGGERSIKVWQWEMGDYKLAQEILRSQGIDARIVMAGGQPRIRIPTA